MMINILYWHWLIFGMALLIGEMFLGSMTILWFGLGALVIATLAFLVPGMGLTWEIFIWALLSCLLTLLWFTYFKPRMADKTKAGIPREAALGEIGVIIRGPVEGRRGMVRFAIPLLGSDEWPFICEKDVAAGDRVVVREISGNTLIVEKR